jgi:hypothetical protein
MAQIYGVLAGLFVCLGTWAATAYVSALTGLLVGLFLLTFFAVSSIYLTGDEIMERQKTFATTLMKLEAGWSERLAGVEHRVQDLESTPTPRAEWEADTQALDALLQQLDRILENNAAQPLLSTPRSRNTHSASESS